MELHTRAPLVLIASDHEWSARSIESILKPDGYAVLRASAGRESLDLVRSSRPDAVILDGRLLDYEISDFCRVLRNQVDIGSTTPIVVTAPEAVGRRQRLEAYDAGAWLFCSQPLDGEVLRAQLRVFVQSKRQADRLREESLIDDETGLYSLRGLAQRARELGAEAGRLRLALACVVIAPAEDPGGRGREPDLVRQLAQLCRQCCRLSDAVGRIAEFEFAVVAPFTDNDGAARLSERLRDLAEGTRRRDDRAAPLLSVRLGYHAVGNYAESPVDAVEMVLRATTALRFSRAQGEGAVITNYAHVPPPANT